MILTEEFWGAVAYLIFMVIAFFVVVSCTPGQRYAKRTFCYQVIHIDNTNCWPSDKRGNPAYCTVQIGDGRSVRIENTDVLEGDFLCRRGYGKWKLKGF